MTGAFFHGMQLSPTLSRLKTIYRASELHQAHMLKNLLESYGVAAHVVDQDAASLRENIERTPEVVVAEEDEEVALGIADIFHKHLTQENPASPNSAALSEASDELTIVDRSHSLLADEDADEETPWTAWPGWPRCPTCDERREAVCPICKNAGNQFSLAHVPTGLETADLVDLLTSVDFMQRRLERHGLADTSDQAALDANVLLMCNICDEAFLPRFYEECKDCGHQFSTGLPVPLEIRRPRVTGALVFGVACLLAYGVALVYLFRR